jgi:hypothetical protein
VTVPEPEDIAVIREWHAKHSNPTLRYSTMPADVAWCWESIATLLAEVDRRIDPDTLDDRETGIYEAGYVAGQKAVAARLRQVAAELEGDGDE